MTVEKPHTYERKRVFLLGATGFIGGEILYKLLTLPQFSKFDITVLTRCHEKAKQISQLTKGQVKPIVGSVRDPFLMYHQLQKADIVINTADVDNVRCAKYISNVATRIKKPYLILHTSGTSVIGDGLSSKKGPTNKIYSDLKNNDEINKLSDDQPHRPVDKIILNIEEQNPEYVRTVIISPPAIFGISDGYIHKESIQIPRLVKLAIKNKQAFTTYSGDYNWSHVHIDDLGDLYIILLSKLLDGEDIKTGKEGYYFAENGVHYWKDISSKIGSTLKERGVIKTDEVANLQPEQIIKLANDEFAPFYWGTNSVSKAELARSYGWEPKFSTADLLHDVEHTVDLAIQEND